MQRFVLSLGLICVACGPPQPPVWSCPPAPVDSLGSAAPRAVTAIYAEPGTATPRSQVIAVYDDEQIGEARVRADGSYLIGLHSRRHGLQDVWVDLYFGPAGRKSDSIQRVHVARGADVTFYVDPTKHSCAGSAWNIQDARLKPALTAASVESSLGVNMLAPGQNDITNAMLWAPFTFEVKVDQCHQPWFAFMRHENDAVSGCWEMCPEDSPACEGGWRGSGSRCTRIAWAAGLCSLEELADDVSAMPPDPHDAGPPDGGVDAGDAAPY